MALNLGLTGFGKSGFTGCEPAAFGVDRGRAMASPPPRSFHSEGAFCATGRIQGVSARRRAGRGKKTWNSGRIWIVIMASTLITNPQKDSTC